MNPADDVTGVILAGGQARRMGGGDKGLLDLAGKPMLAHVIQRLAPQVARLVLNVNGDPLRFAAFALPVVADAIPSHDGPLAGVLAGMRWAVDARPSARRIVTVSTDMPFLPEDLAVRLLAAIDASSPAIALASSGGRVHPVAGLWPVALAPDLATALGGGERGVMAWADRHDTVAVDFPFVKIGDRSIDPFFNVNTPEDLAHARRLLGA